MSALEAHPITEHDASVEDLPEASEPTPVEADDVPEDAQTPTDVNESPEVLADAPNTSAAAVPVTSALPPKNPHSKLSQAEAKSKVKTETQSPQVQFGRVPSSGRFRAKDGATHRRTFTARPPEGCSRHVTRADYTHNEARLVDIARETRSLVTRLEHIYGRQVGPSIAANSPPRGKPCNEAPTHRNRKTLSEKIAAENLRIYNRLQQVKPSKDTAAAQLRREWATTQKYSRNCNKNARRKGKSPARHAQKAPAAESYAGVSMDHTAAEPAPVLSVTVPSTVNESAAEPPAEPALAESHPIDLEA